MLMFIRIGLVILAIVTVGIFHSEIIAGIIEHPGQISTWFLWVFWFAAITGTIYWGWVFTHPGHVDGRDEATEDVTECAHRLWRQEYGRTPWPPQLVGVIERALVTGLCRVMDKDSRNGLIRLAVNERAFRATFQLPYGAITEFVFLRSSGNRIVPLRGLGFSCHPTEVVLVIREQKTIIPPEPAPEPTTPKDAGTPDMPTVSENIRNAFKLSGTELRQYVENMRILGIAEMIAEDFEHTRQLCTRNASLFARAADECLEETKRIVAEAEARQRSLSRCLLDWKMNAARQRAIAEKCSVILGMLNTPETPTGEPPAPPASFQPNADTPSEPTL